MMLDCGVRESEVCGVTLDDVNLSQGGICVLGKGAKERNVPIGEFVTSLIYYYIHYERPKQNLKGSNHLFLSKKCNPMTPNAIKLIFSRLAK
jgi:site-specific recombinase XerD